jgi:ribosomal protein S18 acetylase RimI-like enzyme
VNFRLEIETEDPQAVRRLVAATGFFTPAELEIAVELAEEAVRKGPASGYCFVMCEESGSLVGYSCYGPIPGTDSSFDLYWIAVDPGQQGRGLGRAIIEEVERRIRSAGGQRVYIETSSKEQYLPTRRFYSSCGYHEEAVLKDFYRNGDSKVIYSKVL